MHKAWSTDSRRPVGQPARSAAPANELVVQVVIVSVLLVAACGGTAPAEANAPGGASAESSAAAEDSGSRPPDFELDTLDGETLRLSDHLGKSVVLIDFWATFCEPCLASMPHLEELYRRHKDKGFIVLGVSIDGPDTLPQVKTEVNKLGVTFPILLDTETRVVALYNPKTSAPYSVLIGRDGRIIRKKEGYTTGESTALDSDVAAALE